MENGINDGTIETTLTVDSGKCRVSEKAEEIQVIPSAQDGI